MFNWSTFLGLLSIAVAIFLGLFFGLKQFTSQIQGELNGIKEKVISIQTTIQNLWDIIRTNPTFGGHNTVY